MAAALDFGERGGLADMKTGAEWRSSGAGCLRRSWTFRSQQRKGVTGWGRWARQAVRNWNTRQLKKGINRMERKREETKHFWGLADRWQIWQMADWQLLLLPGGIGIARARTFSFFLLLTSEARTDQHNSTISGPTWAQNRGGDVERSRIALQALLC